MYLNFPWSGIQTLLALRYQLLRRSPRLSSLCGQNSAKEVPMASCGIKRNQQREPVSWAGTLLFPPSLLSFLFFTPFSYQAFDLAYHLWCGSAQKQHETHHAEIHQIESRLKNLENHYRALRRKCDDLKTHQKAHQASMEDTVLSSEEDLLDIPISFPNRSRRGSHASGLAMLGGHGS